MPKKPPERAARFANLAQATFVCPHCSRENTYNATILPEVKDDITMQCRSCRRRFAVFALTKDRIRCSGCRLRLREVHYREGSRVYPFCADCAAVFDSLLDDFRQTEEQFLQGIVRVIQHKVRSRRARQHSHPDETETPEPGHDWIETVPA